jgi:HK97 family phage major capsid protein
MLSILDGCLDEDRGMTPGEKRRYDLLDADFDEARERAFLDRQAIKPEPDSSAPGYGYEDRSRITMTEKAISPERRAFRDYILRGVESRALAKDSDTAGGFLVPTEVSKEIFSDLDNELFIRNLATKFQVEYADALRIPRMDTDFGDPTWTAEIQTGNEDSDLDFEAIEFHPHPLARRIKISNDLLRMAPHAEDFVIERMRQVIGQVMENAYLQGNGAGQPLGIFTAHANGVSTARDVTTGATSSNITYDHLVSCIGAIKSQWRSGCVWIGSRLFEERCRKLKSGDGVPLISQAMDAKRVTTLLGFPLYTSEYVPNQTTWSASAYVAALINPRYYYIVDSMNIEIAVLRELYAATNETGYIIRCATDGNVISENCCVRVQLGS